MQIYRLAERQGWRCFYCGLPITFLNVTRDHIRPLSKGGNNHINNLVASCRGCNHDKGSNDRPSEEYLEKKKHSHNNLMNTNFRSIRTQESVEDTITEIINKKIKKLMRKWTGA